MNERIWKVVGINFDHFHMGDLLRFAYEHPKAQIAGICDRDPARMQEAIRNFQIPHERVFTDLNECLDRTRPDFAILCPSTADHVVCCEQVAAHGVHVLIEKPFAANVADADRMIASVKAVGRQLAINWPLRWYPTHATTYRLIQEGAIGEVIEVHYYDGNRGPLWHGADKIAKEPSAHEKSQSWFYRRAAGGGSLQDYLGYGSTLGTWFQGGRKPSEVCCMCDQTGGLEVDEHSITIARYEQGLSKFETRWGTFSDPWTHQPQPKCGFVIRGTEGTISSYDFEPIVTVQTRNQPEGRAVPVDSPTPSHANPIAYLIDCLQHEREVEGPLSPSISRVGQQIVDTAVLSVLHRSVMPLVP
jgi:glucose-fructose oxidoreductase